MGNGEKEGQKGGEQRRTGKKCSSVPIVNYTLLPLYADPVAKVDIEDLWLALSHLTASVKCFHLPISSMCTVDRL